MLIYCKWILNTYILIWLLEKSKQEDLKLNYSMIVQKLMKTSLNYVQGKQAVLISKAQIFLYPIKILYSIELFLDL